MRNSYKIIPIDHQSTGLPKNDEMVEDKTEKKVAIEQSWKFSSHDTHKQGKTDRQHGSGNPVQ